MNIVLLEMNMTHFLLNKSKGKKYDAFPHLKGVWRVVHTVHPQAVARGAGLHAPEHSQLQPLDGSLRQGLAHQGVRAWLVQQQVAARRVH